MKTIGLEIRRHLRKSNIPQEKIFLTDIDLQIHIDKALFLYCLIV